MAYTPENNPYIPGDPYSYDLKWVVTNIKDLIANYTGQIDELKAYIMDYINSLDLSPIVAAQLQEMYDNGDFDAIIASFITDNKVLLVDTDQSAIFTDTEKRRGRKNIAAASTNPNLLDNPWWPSAVVINQRGVSSITQQGAQQYFIDRWKIGNSNGAVDYSLGLQGITITPSSGATGYMYHLFEHSEMFDNMALTASVKMNDGTIYEGSIIRDYGNAQTIINQTELIAAFGSTNQFYLEITGAAKTITAVKLEIGNASTLAVDVPPNYEEELAKCQRYYKVLPNGYTVAGFALTSSAAVFTIPWEHRAAVNPTITGYFDQINTITGSQSATTVGLNMNSPHHVRLTATGLSLTAGTPVTANAHSSGVTLSAEL